MNYPRLEEEILGGRMGPGPGWQHKKMWSGAVYISNRTWCKEEIFLKENKFSSSYIQVYLNIIPHPAWQVENLI